MKHRTGITGWPSGNILDFRARLLEVWGSNPGGKKKFVCVYLQAGIFKTRNLNCLLQIYCPFAKLTTAHFSEQNCTNIFRTALLCRTGAYKSGKMKFPEFSMFSRPSKQSFPDNYKVKTRCNKLPQQSVRQLSCRITEYFIEGAW